MVGRPESPLEPADGPLQRLAFELRTLRAEAGSPTYREMAERTGCGASTLSQAAGGERLPTLPTFQAYVRACGADTEEWERRWQQASREISEEQRPADQNAVPPYRGLERFEPADRDLFFGRDALVEQLARKVREHRLVAVVGASGIGKSSLLRAGLIPALQTGQTPAGLPSAIRIVIPSRRSASDHARLLQPSAGRGDTVVVIDQFEELFTLGADRTERGAFIDLLLNASGPDRRLRVVIAVRADFFGRCAEHAGLAEALRDATLLVGPMDTVSLREAIVRPAAAGGLIVERSLTARIVAEAADQPGSLPLMSHALLETWRRRRGRALTEEMYDAIGGIHGAIAATAEDVYNGLSQRQARAARQILLRLVTPGDGTQDTRRPTDRTELEAVSPESGHVLEQLIRARLLTSDGEIVELAHEALISAWPRCRSWIDVGRERLWRQRQLTEAASAWDDLDGDPGALYRGSRLTAAEESFPTPESREDFTPLERAFLTASLSARTRRRRRVRVLTTAVAALVALALVAGGVAWQQTRISERRRVEAVARRVAGVADSTRYTDPAEAMKLSLAAWSLAHTAETRSALLGAAMQRDQDQFSPADQIGGFLLTNDGRSLVQVASTAVTTWDVRSHRRTGIYKGPGDKGGWDARALSADGRELALQSRDGAVELWDVTGGHPVGGLLSPWPMSPVAFGSGGRSLLTIDNADFSDATARLWDVRTRRPLFHHRLPGLRSAAVSADDRLVALCPEGGPVQLRRVAGDVGVPLRDAPVLGQMDECAMAFSPDGRRITVAARRGWMETWDTGSGALLARIPRIDVAEIRYSADGKFLAAVGPSTVVMWRQPFQDEPVLVYPVPPDDPVFTLRIDPGGPYLRYLVRNSWGTAVRTVWPGQGIDGPTYQEPMEGALLSPDAQMLAVLTPPQGGERLRLTATADGRILTDLPHTTTCGTAFAGIDLTGRPLNSCRGSMAISADGRTAAYTPQPVDRPVSRQRMTIWRAGNTRTFDLRLPSPARLRHIALDPDGTSLFVVLLARNGTERTEDWDVQKQSRIRVISGIGGESVAVDPRGRWLAASDGRYADLSTGQVHNLPLGFETDDPPTIDRITQGTRSGISGTQVSFSPDGRYLAFGDSTGRLTLFDGHLARLGSMSGPASGRAQDSVAPTTALAFSPDSRTLAAADLNGSVQLWDVPTGQPLGSALTLSGSGDPVQSLAFTPDGAALYAASDHAPLRKYTISPESATAQVCKRVGGGLSKYQWQESIPEIPYRKAC
jgi:WD40 repeat protein/transcriptional regulator with XRE-family HTH domain